MTKLAIKCEELQILIEHGVLSEFLDNYPSSLVVFDVENGRIELHCSLLRKFDDHLSTKLAELGFDENYELNEIGSIIDDVMGQIEKATLRQ